MFEEKDFYFYAEGGFRGGKAILDPLGVKINVYSGVTIHLTFFVLSFYSFLNISSCYSLLLFLFISLLILLFLYLNCLLYCRHAFKHTLGKSNEKSPRKFQFGKKSAKIYHCLYSSKEQLQVAL